MDQGWLGWGMCSSTDSGPWAAYPTSILSPSSCAGPCWPPDCHGLSQGPWGQGWAHLDPVTRPSWGSGGGGAK